MILIFNTSGKLEEIYELLRRNKGIFVQNWLVLVIVCGCFGGCYPVGVWSFFLACFCEAIHQRPISKWQSCILEDSSAFFFACFFFPPILTFPCPNCLPPGLRGWHSSRSAFKGITGCPKGASCDAGTRKIKIKHISYACSHTCKKAFDTEY